MDPLRREFLKYVFSKQGQRDVIKDGYFPVSFKIAQKALAAAGVRIDSVRIAAP
jgi:phosphate transport system substrate-binding protein